MKDIHTAARRLASLLTQYDQKQSTKRGHNPYGLALYLEAVHRWEDDPKTADQPLSRLAEYFTTAPGDDTDFCLAPVRKFVREMGWLVPA
jgi:hypothetical protein